MVRKVEKRKVERRKSVKSGKEVVKPGIEHVRVVIVFANCYG